MELSSSKIEKFLTFQEMELFSPKINKVLIFSQKTFFLYFRKWSCLKKPLIFQEGTSEPQK